MPATLARRLAAVLACTAFTAPLAQAFVVDTGNTDVELRWDNALRYSLGWRAEGIDPAFGNDPTYDETEYRFGRGQLMTNRFDLLSEVDLVYQRRFGARVSAAGWFDAAYGNSAKTNPGLIDSSGVVPGPSVPYSQIGNYDGNAYSSYTRRYTAGGAEFLDAFVFANLDAGSVPVTLKLGQHTVYWGESLFTTFHGIAYSQSPLDGLKAANSPGITAKEVFLPLQQLSMQAQLTSRLSVAAQYYLDWKPNRLPEGGTYFGGADLFFNGPDRAFLGFMPGGQPMFMRHGPAIEPAHSRGNWGANLRWSPQALGQSTIGFYYRQFDEKQPWVPLLKIDPTSPLPADYHLAYARGTQLLGLSYVTGIGAVSVGAELSYRKNTALNSTSVTVVPPSLLDFDGTEGARGDTWHALVNGVYVLPRTALWETGTLQAELVYSRLQRVTSRPEIFNGIGYACPAGSGVDQGCATRSVWLMQVGFEPQWLQVMPGVDVAMPMSLAYGLHGNGATLNGGNEGASTWSIGVRLDVRSNYQIALKYSDGHARVQEADGRVTGSNGNAVQNDHGWVSLSFGTSF